MCRLCLVEVEGARKPMPSCVTEVAEGQVVHTQSDRARELRRGVLEFYLVNHPLDCPICDQSGECKLQDYVNQEGRGHGRGREPKRVFGRDDFGGDVLFYGDRCVMCTRCVRFMNEVAQDERLCVVERGSRSIIDTFFEQGLEGSPFAGNIVDICPVGALVSKDFLYKARAWDLDHTPSVCPNCSHGCNIELHTRDNVIQRLRPRENAAVNGHWMCDYGRHAYEWLNHPDRVETPMMRGEDGRQRPTDWPTVLEALTGRLRTLSEETSSAIVSPFASNEDLGAVARLLDLLGQGSGVYRMRRAEDELPLPGFPTLVRRRELAPNGTGADILGFTRTGEDDGTGGLEEIADHTGAVFVLGDPLHDAPTGYAKHASCFVYLGHVSTPAAAEADFVLPITMFTEQEGTFTNAQSRVQRFWPGVRGPGVARPAWLVLGAVTAALTESALPTRADEAFDLLGAHADAFRGIDYASIGTAGALLNEPVGLAG